MNVLIVEDDPMVQFIHRNYLEKLTLFTDIYSSESIEEAVSILENKIVNLVLLDIDLRDQNGLDLLKDIRKNQHNIEVILITAANESQTVMQGFHLGILDYLIKPFTFERFEQSIQLFMQKRKKLNHPFVNQDQIDQILGALSSESLIFQEEKGINRQTLQLIIDATQTFAQPFTIQELSEAVDLSHVSVRKYIAFLEKNDYLESESVYLKVGRPYKVYKLKVNGNNTPAMQ